MRVLEQRYRNKPDGNNSLPDEQIDQIEPNFTDHFAVTYLTPFNTSQVRRFVANWYGQYEPNTTPSTPNGLTTWSAGWKKTTA